MKKILLLSNLICISCFGATESYVAPTNTLLSKSNISYQFNYDLKGTTANGAFTNTIKSIPTNGNLNIKFSKFGDTNTWYGIIASNNAIRFIDTSSNGFAHFIISNDVTIHLLADSIYGGITYLGSDSFKWIVRGQNSSFAGSTFGFMAPTNITVTAINVSGNVAATETAFGTPTISQSGMYRVEASCVVTQACVGAFMHIGCVASNHSGFITNWIIRDLPLNALTNMSGSIITSNANHNLGYTTPVNAYSSATALGYITFSVTQIQ